MLKQTVKVAALVMALGFGVSGAVAQQVREPKAMDANWSKPYKPFRIAGNLYYVGTYDLACYLVVTPAGNILINTGLAASADLIKANVKALGFKMKDIKILLTTQAHFDHMGAMAAIQKLTGAKVMIDKGDAGILADGGKSDYAMGGAVSLYMPVKPDRFLQNGDVITLGNTQLTLLHHPGHTKGSCSYLLTVTDDKHAYKVLIANMPTIVTEEKFANVKAYPGIANDYAYTFKAMKNLKFDIWLASHASQFGLHTKHKPGDGYNPAAFIDRAGYDKLLADLQQQFNKKMAER